MEDDTLLTIINACWHMLHDLLTVSENIKTLFADWRFCQSFRESFRFHEKWKK
jgi:hypothetical protein